MDNYLDRPTFKLGIRLKRLQAVSKVLKKKSKKLYVEGKFSGSESGSKLVVEVEASLAGFSDFSSKDVTATMLDGNEEKLMEAALAIIGCLERDAEKNRLCKLNDF